MDIGGSILLTMIVVISLSLFIRHMRLWYVMSHFPGPTAYPIIGMLYMFHRDPREFFKMMMNYGANFASLHPNAESKTMVAWHGPVPVVITGHGADMERILASSKQLDKGIVYRKTLTAWLGDGLLVSKGKKWKSRRKLLTPSFHFSVLSSFVDVFNEKARTLTEKLGSLAGPNPVEVFRYVTLCTLDVICGTAMGIDIRAQEGANKEYVSAIVEMCDLLQERQKYPWLWLDVIYNLLPNGKKHKRYLKILHNMTKTVIQERLKERTWKDTGKPSQSSHMTKNKRKMAFLDVLLKIHQEDDTFTLDDVKEEVDTFMFEGHDTTASAISWALFMIGHHPQVQEKVFQELNDIFGDDKDRAVTSEDIQNLQYLGYVIKETLRMYPPVPVIGRQLEEDVTFSGRLVPKGTLVVLNIFWLHHSSEIYPFPDVFNPDNFLPESVEERDPFSFVPFSAGARNCIGQKFAVMEIKVILANLLRKLKFRSLQSRDDVSPIGQIVLRPYNGINMEITMR